MGFLTRALVGPPWSGRVSSSIRWWEHRCARRRRGAGLAICPGTIVIHERSGGRGLVRARLRYEWAATRTDHIATRWPGRVLSGPQPSLRERTPRLVGAAARCRCGQPGAPQVRRAGPTLPLSSRAASPGCEPVGAKPSIQASSGQLLPVIPTPAITRQRSGNLLQSPRRIWTISAAEMPRSGLDAVVPAICCACFARAKLLNSGFPESSGPSSGWNGHRPRTVRCTR